jgi:hypothetical protein
MNVIGKVACAVLGIALCTLHRSPAFTQSVAQAADSVVARTVHQSVAIAFIQAPEVVAAPPTGRFPLGGRLVRLQLREGSASASAVIPLTPQFFAAADPHVSADGRMLLFAAQTERHAAWQIWETPGEGGNLRQVTHCTGDCVQGMYLPEGEIAYTSLQGKGAADTSEVWVCRNNGAAAHPITFGPGSFELEAVLHSGRLLLSAESPLVVSHAPNPLRSLYLVDPDGSGLTLLRQDITSAVIRGGTMEGADGTILFLQRDAVSGSEQKLARIRPGALHATAMEHAHSAYASVSALNDETLLVSRGAPGHRYDLYQLPVNGTGHEQMVYQDAHSSSVQAIALVPHPEPLAYRSILHPDRKSGRVLCLDAYASKDFSDGRLPGRIVFVRSLLKLPSGETILGEAPVQQDGSFYATVPADVPIRLQLIGAQGEILKQQRSWMWVRAGEDRGCVGCHESQALTPENRSPMALQRFDTPTSLLGQTVPNPGTLMGARP